MSYREIQIEYNKHFSKRSHYTNKTTWPPSLDKAAIAILSVATGVIIVATTHVAALLVVDATFAYDIVGRDATNVITNVSGQTSQILGTQHLLETFKDQIVHVGLVGVSASTTTIRGCLLCAGCSFLWYCTGGTTFILLEHANIVPVKVHSLLILSRVVVFLKQYVMIGANNVVVLNDGLQQFVGIAYIGNGVFFFQFWGFFLCKVSKNVSF